MKVSKKIANIILIAGAVLGVLLFFGMKLEYPRIAQSLGNPPWLGGALTALTIIAGILAAFSLFKKRDSN
jgi:hypothetical protein